MTTKQTGHTPGPWVFDGRSEIRCANDTSAETAANVRTADLIADMDQDDRNAANPGYCRKCHTYCYGDCTDN